MSWNECSNALFPLRRAEVRRPVQDVSEMISKVVAEPGDENVASKEPPLRLCTDGDFGITRLIVVAPTDAIGWWLPLMLLLLEPVVVRASPSFTATKGEALLLDVAVVLIVVVVVVVAVAIVIGL